MPKIKTRRAAAKRFKFTGAGKVKINKAFRRHLLTHKSTATKRHLRKSAYASKTNLNAIKKMLPYG